MSKYTAASCRKLRHIHLSPHYHYNKRQEGVHQQIYKPIFVQVTTVAGETLHCRCYQQVRPLEDDRRPSVVYKNIMIRGARENGVPEDYIVNHLEKIVDNGYNGEVEISLDLMKKPE